MTPGIQNTYLFISYTSKKNPSNRRWWKILSATRWSNCIMQDASGGFLREFWLDNFNPIRSSWAGFVWLELFGDPPPPKKTKEPRLKRLRFIPENFGQEKFIPLFLVYTSPTNQGKFHLFICPGGVFGWLIPFHPPTQIFSEQTEAIMTSHLWSPTSQISLGEGRFIG